MLKTVSTANGLVSPTFSGDVTLSNGNLVIGTSGNVNDVVPANSLLHGEETTAFADSGYRGAHKRPDAKPGVTWQIAEGIDVRTPIYGRTILTTHGDRMGTGGGQGFAGPELPILRGAHKVRAQAFSAGMGCDLILSGHYHTSTNLRGVLANGSVPGYSEYGNGLRAALEPPQQWVARFSMAWGLCDRLPVQLGEAKAKMRERRAA
jgi:hypothetical protein